MAKYNTKHISFDVNKHKGQWIPERYRAEIYEDMGISSAIVLLREAAIEGDDLHNTIIITRDVYAALPERVRDHQRVVDYINSRFCVFDVIEAYLTLERRG